MFTNPFPVFVMIDVVWKLLRLTFIMENHEIEFGGSEKRGATLKTA